jgi:signal transduction histidine kinase
MPHASSDTNWPRLLSLSVHEFRTPISVAAGYVRMLLSDRAGAVSEQQRRMLQETEKSCARLSALVAELSDLANLEGGTAPLNRKPLDLRALLADAIAALPDVTDRDMQVDLTTGDGPAMVHGDATRLKTAFASVVHALRRELVTSTRLIVRERTRDYDGRPASWIAIGDGDRIDGLETAVPETLTTFDEWRGGCGLSLVIGRRVIEVHGGALWSPPDGTRAGAVVALPHDRA